MNMTFDTVTLLKLGACVQFSILIASALTPVVLDWKAALRTLPPFLQRLFWVYGVFIVLTIVGLATLSYIHAEALAAGDPVARSVAAFVAVFWGARLLVQWFVFDVRIYLTNNWLKMGYQMLGIAFVFLTLLYTGAAGHWLP